MANDENLIPIKDTQRAKEIGALGGKAKKGSKHISTHIQEMLNDPDFELKMKDGTILTGRPMAAIIKTAIAKAVSGDMRAFDMLGKYGYGSKLDITTDGESLNTGHDDLKLIAEVIKDANRNREPNDPARSTDGLADPTQAS